MGTEMIFIFTLPFSEPAKLFQRLTVRYVNILYKYYNANLGPLLQTCKCRVQSSSTVIYAFINLYWWSSKKNVFWFWINMRNKMFLKLTFKFIWVTFLVISSIYLNCFCLQNRWEQSTKPALKKTVNKLFKKQNKNPNSTKTGLDRSKRVKIDSITLWRIEYLQHYLDVLWATKEMREILELYRKADPIYHSTFSSVMRGIFTYLTIKKMYGIQYWEPFVIPS